MFSSARYPKDMINYCRTTYAMFNGSMKVEDAVEEDMEDEILDVIDEPEVKIDVDDPEKPNYEDATEEMLAQLIGDYQEKIIGTNFSR